MNKKILRLAIPNILSNLSVPLLSSVDTAVVGHLEETYYLGAIAIGAMIFNFIYWGFGFLRMGTTGLTAQSHGSKDDSEAINILSRAIFLATIISIGLIVFQYPIKLIAFYFVESSDKVEFFAKEYFDIRIWAAPATLMLYAFHGWFLGMQNSKYPLYLSILVNISNIILNLFFIYVMGMKSDGVALGTVISQYLGLLIAILLIAKKYKSYVEKLLIKKEVLLKGFKKFLSLNTDIFIRTVCLIFAFTYFTIISAKKGDEILAANTILLQLWMILSYGVDGFAFAAESLVGKYIGQRNKAKLKEAIEKSFIWGISLGALVSLTYFLFDEIIIKVYTNNERLIELCLKFFVWTIIAPLINSFCFIWDGIFIGATETKAMRNSMLVSTFVFYLPVMLLFEGTLGNNAIWLAMLSFMFARGLLLTLYSKRIFRRIMI